MNTPTVAEPHLSPSRRVLIVDDEPLVGELLQEILKIFGYAPVYCSAPDAALAMLQEESFDLLLLDCRMPAMSGAQFFEWVRSTNPDLAGRVVFLTGDTHSDDTQFLLRSTGSLHLGKPFQFESIKAVLEEALQRSEIFA